MSSEAGNSHVTMHRLRHTCSATALDSTHDLRAVRDSARHSAVSTAEGYTRTTEKRPRYVLAAMAYGGGGA